MAPSPRSSCQNAGSDEWQRALLGHLVRRSMNPTVSVDLTSETELADVRAAEPTRNWSGRVAGSAENLQRMHTTCQHVQTARAACRATRVGKRHASRVA
jgi:hypothetical protein